MRPVRKECLCITMDVKACCAHKTAQWQPHCRRELLRPTRRCISRLKPLMRALSNLISYSFKFGDSKRSYEMGQLLTLLQLKTRQARLESGAAWTTTDHELVRKFMVLSGGAFASPQDAFVAGAMDAELNRELWTCAHEPDPQTAQYSCQYIKRMRSIVIFFIRFKKSGVGFVCTGP